MTGQFGELGPNFEQIYVKVSPGPDTRGHFRSDQTRSLLYLKNEVGEDLT